MQSGIHQIGTIHKDMQMGSFGKRLVIQFVYRPVYPFEHLRRILPAQHLHDTFHTVGIVAHTVEEA